MIAHGIGAKLGTEEIASIRYTKKWHSSRPGVKRKISYEWSVRVCTGLRNLPPYKRLILPLGCGNNPNLGKSENLLSSSGVLHA